MKEKIKKRKIFPEIDVALYDRLKKLAQKEKRTVSCQLELFIEEAMDGYLSRQEAKHA